MRAGSVWNLPEREPALEELIEVVCLVIPHVLDLKMDVEAGKLRPVPVPSATRRPRADPTGR